MTTQNLDEIVKRMIGYMELNYELKEASSFDADLLKVMRITGGALLEASNDVAFNEMISSVRASVLAATKPVATLNAGQPGLLKVEDAHQDLLYTIIGAAIGAAAGGLVGQPAAGALLGAVIGAAYSSSHPDHPVDAPDAPGDE